MTTIKLIPQEMEFNVSLDSAALPSLFNQSLETTIDARIETTLKNNEFTRKVRDWLLESIDTDDIARGMSRYIDYEEISERICDRTTLFEDDNLHKVIMDDPRFGNKLRSALETLVTSAMINNAIEEKIQEYLTALAVDAADRAVKIISSRLDKGADE
jgi:hypothetical protein